MNDTWYVQKGVELCPDVYPWDYWKRNLAYAGDSEEWHQIHSDALAAQLVRQVDAINREPLLYCNIRYDSTSISEVHTGKILGRCKGTNDRTMNTIRAIVDSKVLSDVG